MQKPYINLADNSLEEGFDSLSNLESLPQSFLFNSMYFQNDFDSRGVSPL